jgi:hypothetical protein
MMNFIAFCAMIMATFFYLNIARPAFYRHNRAILHIGLVSLVILMIFTNGMGFITGANITSLMNGNVAMPNVEIKAETSSIKSDNILTNYSIKQPSEVSPMVLNYSVFSSEDITNIGDLLS